MDYSASDVLLMKLDYQQPVKNWGLFSSLPMLYECFGRIWDSRCAIYELNDASIFSTILNLEIFLWMDPLSPPAYQRCL